MLAVLLQMMGKVAVKFIAYYVLFRIHLCIVIISIDKLMFVPRIDLVICDCSFCQYLKKVVCDNLEQSRLGGVPGTYSLVRSYLKLQLPMMAMTVEVSNALSQFTKGKREWAAF